MTITTYYDSNDASVREYDTEETAASLGYRFYGETKAGEGYRLLRIGEKAHAGDEYLQIQGRMDLEWTTIQPEYVGLPVSTKYVPVRRQMWKVEVPKQNIPRWKCGHEKDNVEKTCCICAVLYPWRDV